MQAFSLHQLVGIDASIEKKNEDTDSPGYISTAMKTAPWNTHNIVASSVVTKT